MRFLMLLGAMTTLFCLSGVEKAHAACAAPAGTAGDVIYNATEKVFQYCDDTAWKAMNKPGTGAGGCAAPALAEGKMVYNADYRVLQGCAGNVHRAFGPPGGVDGWSVISVSSSYSCGVKLDGSAWCWGPNNDGQLGTGTTTWTTTPAPVTGSSQWLTIATGTNHTCGIKSGGTLWCWGSNDSGQIGDNTTGTDRLAPIAVNGGGTWKAVSAGLAHTCAIKSDDTLWCWGSNSSGQVGDNTSGTNRLVPTAVNGGGTWKKISIANSFSCGIKSDDTLWCWGANSSGRTGLNTSTGNTLAPTGISGGGTWKQVNAGGSNGCAIKSDDTAWCWGPNGSGQVGDNTSGTNRLVPTAVNGGASWKRISAGKVSSTCGIKADDTLWCWGNNFSGAIGDNTTTTRLVPTAVAAGGTWKEIAAGACAIKSNNMLVCWGSNTSGQLGINSYPEKFVPTEAAGGGSWKYIASGGAEGNYLGQTCGIKSDDTLWCWGNGSEGQLGNNTTGYSVNPVTVSGGGAWKQVTGGYATTCAIKSDDTLWCWGRNSSGQVGDNTNTQRLVPTTVSGGGTWKQVSMGSQHSCAIKSDDTIHCWGSNSGGRLGDGTTTPRWLPTAINGGGTWKQVSAGTEHTCAIKSDDTLWCWGQNWAGQFGNAGTAQSLVPTAAGGGGAWKAVSSGEWHTCGIKSDDTLWCWGWSGDGQLGNNAVGAGVTSPVTVNGGGTWKAVTTGYGHTCGVKSDDTLWCWGSNDMGQIGIGIQGADVLVPTAVSGGATWLQISAGDAHACGITLKDDRTWCWGSNDAGELGDLESPPFATVAMATWCGSPAGAAGTLKYNSDFNVLQYCDGAGWVAAGGGSVPGPVPKKVFVTSTTYDGNLGGVAGADAKCQARAVAGELNGTYKAYLASSAQDPDTDLNASTGPYVLTTGTTVAANWTLFASYTPGEGLNAAIDKDEFGATVAAAAWTGLGGADVCSDWASASNAQNGTVGSTSSAGHWFWRNNGGTTCDTLQHLYCIQQ